VLHQYAVGGEIGVYGAEVPAGAFRPKTTHDGLGL
jgi:hypothetical protein